MALKNYLKRSFQEYNFFLPFIKCCQVYGSNEIQRVLKLNVYSKLVSHQGRSCNSFCSIMAWERAVSCSNNQLVDSASLLLWTGGQNVNCTEFFVFPANIRFIANLRSQSYVYPSEGKTGKPYLVFCLCRKTVCIIQQAQCICVTINCRNEFSKFWLGLWQLWHMGSSGSWWLLLPSVMLVHSTMAAKWPSERLKLQFQLMSSLLHSNLIFSVKLEESLKPPQ